MLITLLSFYLSASTLDHPLTPCSALYPLTGRDWLPPFCVLNGCLPLWKIGAKRMRFIKQFLRQGIIWVVLQKVDSSLLCFCLWFLVLGRKFYKWKDLLDQGQRMYMNSSLPSSDIHITWVFSLELLSHLWIFLSPTSSTLELAAKIKPMPFAIREPKLSLPLCTLLHIPAHAWWAVFALTYRGDLPSVVLTHAGRGAVWEATG